MVRVLWKKAWIVSGKDGLIVAFAWSFHFIWWPIFFGFGRGGCAPQGSCNTLSRFVYQLDRLQLQSMKLNWKFLKHCLDVYNCSCKHLLQAVFELQKGWNLVTGIVDWNKYSSNCKIYCNCHVYTCGFKIGFVCQLHIEVRTMPLQMKTWSYCVRRQIGWLDSWLDPVLNGCAF